MILSRLSSALQRVSDRLDGAADVAWSAAHQVRLPEPIRVIAAMATCASEKTARGVLRIVRVLDAVDLMADMVDAGPVETTPERTTL